MKYIFVTKLINDPTYKYNEEEVDVTGYTVEDLQNGLIIDITADQFDDFDIPVYVGYMIPFHSTFEFRQAHNYDGLRDGRLINLFRMIERYL